MKSLTVDNSHNLDSMVQSYVVQGYMVAHKTDHSVTLVKKKTFNWIIAGLGFLFAFIGLFLYLGYYMMKKDDIITINVQKAAKTA